MTKSQLDEMKNFMRELMIENKSLPLLTIEQTEQSKQKMEFSKKWLFSCMAFTLIFVSLSYVLAFFDKNPVEELSKTIINALCAVDGISFVGYNVQNCVRAWSSNKSKANTDSGII